APGRPIGGQTSSNPTRSEAAVRPMVHNTLDATDRGIVDALVSDGRMSIRALAQTLHISRANAYARVERLLSSGVIRGFHADVDPAAAGMSTSAYITINLRQGE